MGLTAFFGLRQHATRPSAYRTDAPLVSCTFLEALRDAWVHSYVLLVERRPVFTSNHIQREFDALMWHVRGNTVLDDASHRKAVKAVEESIGLAVNRFRNIRETLAPAVMP
jgi:hypothetical protein